MLLSDKRNAAKQTNYQQGCISWGYLQTCTLRCKTTASFGFNKNRRLHTFCWVCQANSTYFLKRLLNSILPKKNHIKKRHVSRRKLCARVWAQLYGSKYHYLICALIQYCGIYPIHPAAHKFCLELFHLHFNLDKIFVRRIKKNYIAHISSLVLKWKWKFI